MDIVLDPAEIRVLGVLLEKQLATPDYYPMTLNALIAGCNQKSSRDPVMVLSESEVLEAMEPLREARMAGRIRTAGSRATKYEHRLEEIFGLGRRDLALLAVLMLRGPQTAGELRTRTARMYEFNGLSEVERALGDMEERTDGPWTIQLARRPGRKEPRFAHGLGGPVEETETNASTGATPGGIRDDLADRVFALEEEIATLREEVAALRKTAAEVRTPLDEGGGSE